MFFHHPLENKELDLPDIAQALDSGQEFSRALQRAGELLYSRLLAVGNLARNSEGVQADSLDWIALALFSKLCQHYYSYILLFGHADGKTQQFLLEQLSEIAITLTYLVEEGDEETIADFIKVSIPAGQQLCNELEQQLQQSPGNQELLALRSQLSPWITQKQTPNLATSAPPALDSDVSPPSELWGPETANTTCKRGEITGLGILSNPARALRLGIKPASWLDLHLNPGQTLESDSSEASWMFDLTRLRDVSHLCLHTARVVLENLCHYPHPAVPPASLPCEDSSQTETRSERGSKAMLDFERLDQDLETLFGWFHNAHCAYGVNGKPQISSNRFPSQG